jgi:hypothetical protein
VSVAPQIQKPSQVTETRVLKRRGKVDPIGILQEFQELQRSLPRGSLEGLEGGLDSPGLDFAMVRNGDVDQRGRPGRFQGRARADEAIVLIHPKDQIERTPWTASRREKVRNERFRGPGRGWAGIDGKTERTIVINVIRRYVPYVELTR